MYDLALVLINGRAIARDRGFDSLEAHDTYVKNQRSTESRRLPLTGNTDKLSWDKLTFQHRHSRGL